MQTVIEGRSIVMVFLDSKGKLSRIGDASRIRKWIETAKPHRHQCFAADSEHRRTSRAR